MTRPRPVASRAASDTSERGTIRPVPTPRVGPQAPAGRRPSPRPRPAPEAGPAPAPDPSPAVVEPQPAEVAADDAEQVAVWELVRRAQTGDAEGFGQLYDRYVDVVFRFLYHRVGDSATAEDFTSETFVRALRRIDSLTFQGRDVGAWLITIARNIVLDHVKSSRYRLEVTTADMRDADRATDGPEDAVLQGLTNAELLAGVAQLSDEQRECVVLRFLQDLSVAETAAAMGKKDGAVKALQHRAVRRLATLLPEGLL
ncbi:RNA polymerase sigma-70 factor, ECF subfamily [Modestobacter sp. DSM 44400]|uniref:sigma-70 family RNA polymerase sigma factor n=1 Tax=Modestobacter sp. DSM 44400 TaxID=1550230 RepID=UPI00089BBE04|nr:sigma-70 family RNA polymerase sigma factor [Modestobacter sp. DSM 44400]SDX54617.1 RNA polymerase sigma-70 factor, ECF subfamily [Modestobacter sp. DSM 44400]